jgi:hypothetical protein
LKILFRAALFFPLEYHNLADKLINLNKALFVSFVVFSTKSKKQQLGFYEFSCIPFSENSSKRAQSQEVSDIRDEHLIRKTTIYPKTALNKEEGLPWNQK